MFGITKQFPSYLQGGDFMLGQGEWFDYSEYEVQPDYTYYEDTYYVNPFIDEVTPPVDEYPSEMRYVDIYQSLYPSEEYPSETRYVASYQEQQAAIQETAQAGGGFFDTLKSIFGVVAPLVMTAVKGGTTVAQKKGAVAKAGVTAPGGLLASVTSSPLLLGGLAVGGYLLLRGRRVVRHVKRRRRK